MDVREGSPRRVLQDGMAMWMMIPGQKMESNQDGDMDRWRSSEGLHKKTSLHNVQEKYSLSP